MGGFLSEISFVSEQTREMVISRCYTYCACDHKRQCPDRPCDTSPPDGSLCAVFACNECVGCTCPSGANVSIDEIDHLSETAFAGLRAAKWPLPPPGVSWRETRYRGV